MKKSSTFYSTLFLLMVFLSGCSLEQNTVTSKIYHNTTAHFNGYYYAFEKTREVEKTILKSLDDDHNQILRLFPKLDTVLAKSYSKDTEEAIKMASISIQRHPNSQWVYKNYVIVGKARLYNSDFQNAIQTLKYVNTKCPDVNIRHEALIYLVRTFTEQQEYDKADEVIRHLEKEKLNKLNAKNLLLEKAYFAQVRGNYDLMVQSLAKSDSLLTKADRKARIYFIVGQVYQKLGFGSEAYNFYKKCLGANPEYEIDFYARLNMAQVARLDNSKDMRTVRKQFQQLLTDAKNIEFRDKIYYELGEFEFKQNHIPEALDNYKLSAHAGTNKRVQGSAFLRAGQIYFDSLKKYELANAYYDSAVASLPPEFENLDQIKKRHEVLGEFVKHTQTIILQDSLLRMADMDSLSLKKILDSTFASREKVAEEAAKKKKKKESTSGGGAVDSSNPFFQNQNSTSTTDWYFGNQSAVAIGQTEFQRIWGSINLEDNWRRSNKSAGAGEFAERKTVAATGPPEKKEEKTEATVDPAIAVFAQLPKTNEQKKEALAKIEEAYFRLGDLYYLQLVEKPNASNSYKKLLQRFPETEFAPEVLYKLYLIAKELKDEDPEKYASMLKRKYPTSTFAKILINPDYLKETLATTEKQKDIYKEAYNEYSAGNLRSAQEKIKLAKAEGETTFTPQLELLEILITGKTEDVTKYQLELGEFIKKYPGDALKPYAENLLAASKSFLEKTEKAKGIRFVSSFEETHYLVFVHRAEDKLSNTVTQTLENFNHRNYRDKNLKTSNLKFSDEYSLTLVSDFPDRTAGLEYLDKLKIQADKTPSIASNKFDIFVITKDNFQIFYRTKALDEYLTFFDRNYQAKNQ